MRRRSSEARRSVLLPWERESARLARLFSARRWRGIALALLVAGLVLAAFDVADRRARIRTTRAGIAEVQRAVAAFRAEVGRCPRSTVELVHPPKSRAGYLTEIPSDGWGRELYVRCPGRRPGDPAEVVSAGPSGSLGTEDNVM